MNNKDFKKIINSKQNNILYNKEELTKEELEILYIIKQKINKSIYNKRYYKKNKK